MNDFSLTESELKQFKEQGYIGPFDLYDPEDALDRFRKIRAQLFDRTHAPYDLPIDSPIANYDRHLDVDLLAEHICRPEIVGRLRSFLGPDVLCWRSEMFPKYPGDEGTDWHQADTFEHASGAPQLIWPGNDDFGGAITVWTAFTECAIENGCLRFIPGTHEEMYYDETKTMEYKPELVNSVEKTGGKQGFFGYDYRDLKKDENWEPDEDRAVSIQMRPGQFVIFWSTLMHASHPNTTEDKVRLGFTSRYVPARVKVYPDTQTINEYGSEINLERYGTVLVSGNDNFMHNRRVTQSIRGVPYTTRYLSE